MFNRVVLRYYGHSAFQWTTPKNIKILIDPFHNVTGRHWFIQDFPHIEPNILLITHPHFDHDAIENIIGKPTILRTPGIFSDEEIIIRAFKGRHAKNCSDIDHFNLIFTLNVANIRFCHLGDNQAAIPCETQRAVGKVDVLMISVDDSCHLLNYSEVDRLISIFQPRVIIPMHYLIEELTDPNSGLEDIKGWLETRDKEKIRMIEGDSIQVSKEDLPIDTEVWLFRSYARK